MCRRSVRLKAVWRRVLPRIPISAGTDAWPCWRSCRIARTLLTVSWLKRSGMTSGSFQPAQNGGTWVKQYLLEVLSEILFLLFHIIDKIESSWVFVSILSRVVLDSLVNEGDLLRICDGHFNNGNILSNIKIYDVLRIYQLFYIFVKAPTKICNFLK